VHILHLAVRTLLLKEFPVLLIYKNFSLLVNIQKKTKKKYLHKINISKKETLERLYNSNNNKMANIIQPTQLILIINIKN
jgi:hypothetical protein